MKDIILIVLYSIYVAIFLGLVLHTSGHPQVLGKYSVKYFALLVFLAAFFIPFILTSRFAFVKSFLKFKKRKITIQPFHKIMVFAITLIAILTLSEIFLRFKYRNYETDSYKYTIDNFNPFLQSQISKQENLTVDSLGFRSEEISVKKPKNTYRIFVLGGSTVLNREVSFEKNAVRLLEKKLNQQFPGKKIEVINAGKDYYTSEHSLIQYLFKVSDLDPDLIIMWHGINDLGESCLLENVVTHGTYKSDYSHNFGAVANIVFDHFRPQPVIQFKLLTLDFLLTAMKDNLYSDFTNKIVAYNKKTAAERYIEEKNTVNVRNFPSIEAYRRNLNYLVELTKDRGVPLILGNQPSLLKDKNTLIEVEKIMFPTLICRTSDKYYSLSSYKYGLDLFNTETKNIAEKNNTMFIDLDKALPKSTDYFFDMVHYTEKGNEKIANTLYDFIVLKDLIPKN